MPDQKAFDKQPLSDATLGKIIEAYNASIAKYDLNNYFEVGDFRYDLKNRLYGIVGELSLENYDLSGLPELIKELICEIFDSQYEANSKKRVLCDQKSAYRAAKKLRADTARANASLPASVPRWRVIHIDPQNRRMFFVKF